MNLCGLSPYGTPFAINDEPALLPLDIVFGKMGKFAHFETGIQEGPDEKFLLKSLTGIDEPVSLIVV